MRYETCCLHNVTLYSLLNEYAVVMTVFSMALARFPTGYTRVRTVHFRV